MSNFYYLPIRFFIQILKHRSIKKFKKQYVKPAMKDDKRSVLVI